MHNEVTSEIISETDLVSIKFGTGRLAVSVLYRTRRKSESYVSCWYQGRKQKSLLFVPVHKVAVVVSEEHAAAVEMSRHCRTSRCHNEPCAVVLLNVVCPWDVRMSFLSLRCNFVRLNKKPRQLDQNNKPIEVSVKVNFEFCRHENGL